MGQTEAAMLRYREEPNLLKRVRVGTPHATALRNAITGCFDLADEIGRERLEVFGSDGLTPAEKRKKLSDAVQQRLVPRLSEVTKEARRLKGHVDAQRAEYGRAPLPPNLLALSHDVQAVEAAAYFAKRELQPASGLDGVSFDMLLDEIASARIGAQT